MATKSKKKPIKTRDYNMVSIIKGATKAGVHKDQKKEANRTAAREKVEEPSRCIQCGFPIDQSEEEEHLDFCSETCEEYFYQ